MLQLASIELFEINLPLVHFFETSFGRTYERRIILIKATDRDGAAGWGRDGSIPGVVVNCPNRLFMGEGRREPVDEIRHESDPNTPYTVHD